MELVRSRFTKKKKGGNITLYRKQGFDGNRMKVKFVKHIRNRRMLDNILDLLTLCNNDFVPPLSSRNSTTQNMLGSSDANSAIPYAYFGNIRRQPAFVMMERGRVIGFLSFLEDYVSPKIPPELTPNVYVTTVIVHPRYRNRGIAHQLYHALFSRYAGYHIFTRTWSTNHAHTKILLSRGFHEHCRIENDRGEGIDTVYYRRLPATREKRKSFPIHNEKKIK